MNTDRRWRSSGRPGRWRSRSWLLAGTATLVLCRLAAQRLPAATTGCSNCVRHVGVSAASCLFNQPEWVEEYRPEEKPAVAVLWDNSASMETRDVNEPTPARPA